MWYIVPCIVVFLLYRCYILLLNIKRYGAADWVPAFEPLSLPGMLFGLGLNFTWLRKSFLYARSNKEAVTITPWAWGRTTIYSNSVEVMRQVSGGGSNHTWIKPSWSSEALLLWGRSVASENFDQWRKHRRVTQPAFNNKTYELVWQETTRLYHEMVETEGWSQTSGSVISIESLQKYTFKLSMCVISSCGFGFPFRWAEPTEAEGQATSLREGMEIIEKWYMLLVLAPKWLWKLPFAKLRHIKEGYETLRKFMNDQVAERKSLVREALEHDGDDIENDRLKRDVFTRLVLASETDGKYKMEDSEILGNTFILLFAGHDTTAATLAATLALLAFHTDEQDLIHEEIAEVIKEEGELSFSNMGKLQKTLSAFLEAVRLYPAGHSMIRECIEDTVLRVPSLEDEKKIVEIPLAKGSSVVVDVIGMQYNSRLYEDPYAFKPSRWIGVPEDAVNAFSVGPRACIGKKFALSEATCFLANVLRDWKIQPLLKPGETTAQWEKRILGNAAIQLTLSITDVPILFVRR